MEILVIIPARGGSKGITHKNIRPFNGLPCIAYTIKAAQKVPYINRIVVSTESEEVKRIAERYGAEVPFLRPESLAKDNSEFIDAAIHLLKKLEKDEGYRPDYVMTLQITSPLRTAADIKQAIKLYFKRRVDSLVSVCRTENLLLTKDRTDKLKILNPEFLSSQNRQQLPAVYKLDGCMISLTKTELMLKKRSDRAGKLIGYEGERWRAVDLDEPQDFVVGELIYKNYSRLKRKIKKFK